MRVSIVGLGYVGSVAAACMASEGHVVIGVDTDESKVRLINSGTSPIAEPGLSDLIAPAVKAGTLRAVTDIRYAVQHSSISIFCVGTPGQTGGSPNFSYVRHVCEQIGETLTAKDDFHVVVARSTLLPGTARSLVIPVLEATSGKKAGTGFGVCVNPEFLREGTAIHDFQNPPKVVVGATDRQSLEMLRSLCRAVSAPFISTSMEVAEAVKYTDNLWHAVKVVFANEVGAICDAANVDAGAVMDTFVQDTKLNISPAYLRPGPAFGGSCLPKDLRALIAFGRSHDVDLPMINSLLPSNHAQIERALQAIERKGRRRIGMLGIGFKADTDDLRESPIVEMIDILLTRGYDVRAYDPNVSQTPINGANRSHALNALPHIRLLLTRDVHEFLDHSETIVVGNKSKMFQRVLEQAHLGHCIVDLVRHLPSNNVIRSKTTARRQPAAAVMIA